MAEKINILYEDNHIIIVEKEAGMLTQGDYSGETSLLDILKDYIKKKYNKPGEAFVGLVHRLDKDVSGLLVFARTSKAAARLQKGFLSGEIKKFYIAIIENSTSSTESNWITLHNNLMRIGDKTVVKEKEAPETENASLRYKIIKRDEKFSLVIINLLTGKKHQIRAQLSHQGMPIAGDKKYGSKFISDKGICLHSVYISLMHPTKKERMSFFSPPPSTFNRFIEIDSTLMQEIKQHIEEIL